MRSLSLLLASLCFCLLDARAATALVSAADEWRFFKGQTAAQANWTTSADAELTAGWLAAPGGFGYGDAGIVGQATVLGDMSGNYSSVYLRRTFRIENAADSQARLRFNIDYDDAYIAYLDGVEISRSPNAPADPVSNTSRATSRHEASCCDAPVNAPTVVDLGLVGARLGAGDHILAIHAFNDDLASSDFHIIPNLDLLAPGECEPNMICSDTTWTGSIVLTANTQVLDGATLVIEPGANIRLAPGVSLRAGAGAKIEVRGSPQSPVTFAINEGAAMWGELAADGANSFLTIRHAEIAGGAVNFRNGATGLMEDTYHHHFKNGNAPIAGCNNAAAVTVRRCHFNVYHETLWRFTPILIEDSLFENADNPSSDALDFDGVPPGSTIRRCTFRHGPQSNTDAIDLGTQSRGVIVEDCLMFNFPNDKGVSVGELTLDAVIRNCLVYGCDSGVAVKDSSTARIYHCTFVNNDFGFRNYNKADPTSPTGGGHILESYNNILWANATTVSLQNGATLQADHSNYSDILWEGGGNLSVDPLFVNAAQRDYRLTANSPLLTAGRDNAQIGTRFPVGAPMAPSHPSFQTIERLPSGEVRLKFWVDSEKTHALLTRAADPAAQWTLSERFETSARPRLIERQTTAYATALYFQLVTPAPERIPFGVRASAR